MKKFTQITSCVALVVTMIACNTGAGQERKAIDQSMKQEKEFLKDAIRHKSPDVQRVDIVGNTVVYTHIFNGIIDEKTYTYDGDVCVEAERVYTFPTQMKALRHYRRAVEKAELYDNIELFNNQVKYDLKKQQHELETKGLTMEQLKAKFDKHIENAKANMKRHDEKMKAEMKKMGERKKDCKNDCK